MLIVGDGKGEGIDLLSVVLWGEKCVGKVSVVGQHDQSHGVSVKTSAGEESQTLKLLGE